MTVAGRIAVFLLVVGTAAAQDSDRKPEAQLLGIEEYRLANGLRVVLYPDQTKPTLTVNLTVLVGSAHEGAGEAGMAHVFEHLLFHGLEGFPDAKDTLNSLGSSYNGTTWFDRTNYFETLNATDENLETAIRLEAARLGRALLRPEDLEKEGKIVEGEFDLGNFFPQRSLYRGMFGAMYDFHAYARDPIGTVEDFKSLKIENIRSFYKRHYTPDNAVLFITGKIEKARTLGLVDRHFKDLKPSAGDRPASATREPASVGERRFTIRRPGDSYHLLAAYRIPGAASPDAATAEVVARILSSEKTGLLYDALVGKGLASTVNVQSMDLRAASPFFAMAAVPKDKDPDVAEAAMIEGMEKRLASATGADLERAKGMVERDFDRLFNSPEALAGQLSQFESAGSWKLLLVRREQAKAVTLGAVTEFAAKYLRRENRVVGRFEPDASAVAVLPDREPEVGHYADLLAKVPASVKSVKGFSYTPAALQAALAWTQVGPAKIGVLTKETKGDDVRLEFRLSFSGRAAVKPALLAGEALGSLLTERTRSLSKSDLSRKLAESKSQIQVAVTLDGASLHVHTKKEAMASVLPLAFEMLRTPWIEEAQLQEYVTRQEGLLKARRDNPQMLIQVEVLRMLFPEGDPRRPRTIEENLEGVKALTLEKLLDFHKAFFGAEGLTGAVVGNVTRDEVSALLAPHLHGDWKASRPPVREPNQGVEEVTTPASKVATPGKPVAFSILVQPLRIRATSSEFVPLESAAWSLFQEPLGSRIPKRIREEEALSYATQGMLEADLEGDFGLVLIFTVTKPENAEKAVGLIKGELDKALSTGITPEELESYKKSYKSRVATMRSDDARIAGAILELERAGLDFTLWSRQDELAAALTLDQVNAALKKYIKPGKGGLVQIGDFK